jgi:DNA-binding MarR family transcriptional regulator
MTAFDPQQTISPEVTRADLELAVLKAVHDRADVKQRDIAEIVGVSLGMTNAILRRLSQKGLVTIKRVNNRNLRYAVSPDGMEAIAKRSYRYFKRTIKNVVYYRDAIERVIRHAARDGYDTVVLVGESDLAFIIEHFCEKYGLSFHSAAFDEHEAFDEHQALDEPEASSDAATTASRQSTTSDNGSADDRPFTVYGEDCPHPPEQEETAAALHLQELLR